MKKKFLSIILFLVFFTGFLHVRAQEIPYDALYKSLEKEFTLNPDGSTDFRYIKEQKLLTYRAFHSLYGETFVVYNPIVQKLKVNEAYTIMADGKKVTAPQNAFNEVLPSYAANAPAFNHLREMVITHTGLERKSTIHLDYELHTEKSTVSALMGNELLMESEPVENLSIKIRIPLSASLYYHLFNSKAEPVKSTEGQYQVFTWKFKDVPALSSEESQPKGYEQYPRIFFSTLKIMDSAYSMITGQPAFRSSANDEMKALVNKLVSDERDRFDIALKIQEHVVDNMRLYPVPVKIALYKCRTPDQTWSSNGGTAFDKAVLMALLFREAGINASVCAVVKAVDAGQRVGSLADIEDFVVAAQFKDEGQWFFSTTSLNPVNLDLILPGRVFLKLLPGKKVEIVSARDPEQMIRVSGNFIVSSDPKLTGEISFYYEGAVYPYSGFKRDKKKLKSGLTGCITTADLKDEKKSIINTANGFQSFIVQSDKPFRRDSVYLTMVIPTAGQGIDSWGIRTLPGKRETSFEIPGLAEESYSFVYTLPAGLELFTPARKVSFSNKAGSYTWEVSADKGKLTIIREIKIKERIISPDKYQDFKFLMDSWNHPRHRELIFVR